MKKTWIVLYTLFILFSLGFIYKTSFVIDGERYYSLFDDAMISMNYARNLVQGNGLVMNHGERVEGITNPLWTFSMAAVHLLPVPQSKICLIVQLTGLLLLLINLFFVRKTALLLSDNSEKMAMAAVFLTAFYLPLINWTLQGMETGLQTLFISAAVWMMLKNQQKGIVSVGSYVLLGMGTLIRIDMAFLLVVITVFSALRDRENKKRHLIFGLLALVLFVGGQTLARIFYYNDPLPNTYYLKMTGYPILLRLTRGFLVWGSFLWNMNLLLVAAAFVMALLHYKKSFGPLVAAVSAQMIYSIYVGGDAWEEIGGSNRYITPVMPMLFILCVFGFLKLGEYLAPGEERKGNDNKILAFFRNHVFSLLVFFSFVQFNSPHGPLNMKDLLLFNSPPHVENNKTMVERALLIKQITTPEAAIAVTWAGAIPYFSERKTVDILGKTDKTIARMEMRQSSGRDRFKYFLPGHLKYDYSYSIGQLQPDAVLQFWGDLQEAEPYINGKYTKLVAIDKVFYLKNGSNAILWQKFMKEEQKN
jgi:arabinofuranosyltransferase